MPAPFPAHRWECATCETTIGTDNPVPALVELVRAAHARQGHDVIEAHTTRGPEEAR